LEAPGELDYSYFLASIYFVRFRPSSGDRSKMAFNPSNSPSLARRKLSCNPAQVGAASVTLQSSLARPVYCVLGIPIDAVDLTAVVDKIEASATARAVLLVSTPNINFIVSSLSDPEFRESLLNSDLCPPDGMPIIWIARLLGLPIKQRAAGADLLERLKTRPTNDRRLTIFLFGGATGVAAEAARRLNSRPCGLHCVGSLNPGFCDISEMSRDQIIDAVNSSGADFLVASLGAKKGQLWLRRNHARLTVPIRAHLGAAINFQSGAVKRAPPLVRAWGFEWLWRIKAERYLWKRYRDDGLVLLRLMLTRVLPLVFIFRWQQFRRTQELSIQKEHTDQSTMFILRGAALEKDISKAIPRFDEALTGNGDVVIDLSDTVQIDARFLGLLLMLRKELLSRGRKLKFTTVPRAIKRVFYLNELGFLLSADTAN
jgi:N-acetylglucosaminyldiphosphoundecaprenol N-acetyl-beta-D-mannosaminyltransferase